MILLKKIKSFFKRAKPSSVLPCTTIPEHRQSISFWTAGIKFESRLENLFDCKIKDAVWLIREPDKESDPNAIHIITNDKKSLGYIGKNKSALLSQMLDEKSIENVGYIIALQSDLKNEVYGVKIAVPISENVSNTSEITKLREIDFAFDTSENNNLYLLLNCDENILTEVKTLLQSAGVLIHKSGISYKPSSFGRFYRWYLRLENDSNKELIEKVLKDNFPVLQEKFDNLLNAEYLELQEEELQELKAQRTEFETKISDLEKSLNSLLKRQRIFSDQFESLTKIFLPQVQLLRDSTDVLKQEVEDYTVALKKINEICADPLFRGKKIQTLEKWFEIHFSTGQKDDGRIYFKRENTNVTVLVSFKQSQKMDIQYLKTFG